MSQSLEEPPQEPPSEGTARDGDEYRKKFKDAWRDGKDAVKQLLAEDEQIHPDVLIDWLIEDDGDDKIRMVNDVAKEVAMKWSGKQLRARIDQSKLVTTLSRPFALDVSDVESALDHRFHNIVMNRPRIPVKVWRLPVNTKRVQTYEVMMAFSHTHHQSIMGTEIITAIVQQTWGHIRALAWIDILFNLAGVVAAAHTSRMIVQFGPRSIHMYFITLFVVTTIKRIIEERYQFRKHCLFWKTYWKVKIPSGSTDQFHSWMIWAFVADNFSDILSIACNLVMIGLLLWIKYGGVPSSVTDDLWIRFCLSLAFGSLWLRLLYSLRVLPQYGPTFLPIFHCINRTTLAFFGVLLFCSGAGVQAYYMMGLQKNPDPLTAAFWQVFQLGFLGHFNMFDFEGVDAVIVASEDNPNTWEPKPPIPGPAFFFAQALFIIITIAITVFLMNLFVGVLSDEYSKATVRAEHVYMRFMAQAMANHLACPWGQFFNMNLGRSGTSEDYLYVVVPEVETMETASALHSPDEADTRKILEKMQQMSDQMREMREEQRSARGDDRTQLDELAEMCRDDRAKLEQLCSRLDPPRDIAGQPVPVQSDSGPAPGGPSPARITPPRGLSEADSVIFDSAEDSGDRQEITQTSDPALLTEVPASPAAANSALSAARRAVERVEELRDSLRDFAAAGSSAPAGSDEARWSPTAEIVVDRRVQQLLSVADGMDSRARDSRKDVAAIRMEALNINDIVTSHNMLFKGISDHLDAMHKEMEIFQNGNAAIVGDHAGVASSVKVLHDHLEAARVLVRKEAESRARGQDSPPNDSSYLSAYMPLLSALGCSSWKP